MKKVSLVVMERERDTSLEQLREVGVLHLEKKSVSSDVLAKLLEERANLRKALGLLRRYKIPKTAPALADAVPFDPAGGAAIVRQALGLSDEKKGLFDRLMFLGKEQRRLANWGDFSPGDFAFVSAHGTPLFPYELSLKDYAALGDETRVIVVSRDKRGLRLFAVGAEIPGASPLVFPASSISEMKGQVAAIHRRLAELDGEFARLALQRGTLEAGIKVVSRQIEFEMAKAGMETLEGVPAAAAVSWLSGFVPADKLGLLKRAAAEKGWAMVCEDAGPNDKPPTLVQNGPLVRIVQPVFSFLGTVPGYREYDISFSFLVFFCLFFAMIFGDAAYGLVLFLVSLAAGLAFKKKSANGGGKIPDAAKLFMLLSACTVVWGAITGAWFSIPVEKLPRFLRVLIIPPFNNTGPLAAFPFLLQKVFNLPAEVPVGDLKTRWNLQFLCFTVALIQLVWARGKNIKKHLPRLTALAQAGWLVMMVGLYFLVLFMLLKVPLPSFSVYLIGGGFALYFVFAEQNGGNFFKNIVKSFANVLSIFLNAVGSFADIISYIRLFAVGLAGSIIAQSFNTMAIPAEGFGSFGLGFVLHIAAAVLILVFGHALNMVMNALSVIVHGVRLNLLEYAGNHLGMEWSGYAYNPFANH